MGTGVKASVMAKSIRHAPQVPIVNLFGGSGKLPEVRKYAYALVDVGWPHGHWMRMGWSGGGGDRPGMATVGG